MLGREIPRALVCPRTGVRTINILQRLLYASPNGDEWYLVKDQDSEEVYVRHVPNEASGGQRSRIELDDFLLRYRGSPQRQALVHLIGTLTHQA